MPINQCSTRTCTFLYHTVVAFMLLVRFENSTLLVLPGSITDQGYEHTWRIILVQYRSNVRVLYVVARQAHGARKSALLTFWHRVAGAGFTHYFIILACCSFSMKWLPQPS